MLLTFYYCNDIIKLLSETIVIKIITAFGNVIKLLTYGFMEVYDMDQIKDYESPDMEIIVVEDSDVITTSGLDGGIDASNPFENGRSNKF